MASHDHHDVILSQDDIDLITKINHECLACAANGDAIGLRKALLQGRMDYVSSDELIRMLSTNFFVPGRTVRQVAMVSQAALDVLAQFGVLGLPPRVLPGEGWGKIDFPTQLALPAPSRERDPTLEDDMTNVVPWLAGKNKAYEAGRVAPAKFMSPEGHQAPVTKIGLAAEPKERSFPPYHC